MNIGRWQTLRIARYVALGVLMTVAGCAPAYHRNSGCRVECGYCAPPPLPYVHYCDGACHSCAVQPYLDDPVPP